MADINEWCVSKFDLTVAVTAHSEAIVAGPTMRSALAAIGAAESMGFSVERLIGLDTPSGGCRAFFRQPRFSDWKIVELEERDLGLSRNALAQAANGEFIAYLDADDLFSENWLTVGVKMLREATVRGEKLILHPEINWFFDAHASVLGNIDQRDANFSRSYFRVRNYYDSLAMAPRAAFLEVSYAARDRQYGFGFEDWRWNLDTISAGWSHAVAPDTIIFKRRRDDSLVIELGRTKTLLWALEAFAIDEIGSMEAT